jgi:hypothetical protein
MARAALGKPRTRFSARHEVKKQLTVAPTGDNGRRKGKWSRRKETEEHSSAEVAT